MNKKHVVAGLGEIGFPIFQLISKFEPTIGYDIDPRLTKKTTNQKYLNLPTLFLHISIPFNDDFEKNMISLSHKFSPEIIVIHSTISPNTTTKIQKKLPIPIIYSPTRGVHKRIIHDLKRYTKFFSIQKDAPKSKWASEKFSKLMKTCGIKTQKMSNPITLELAKIVVDTSYYGWLINYAQISNLIAKKYNVNYDEMWLFADEIQKFLGNRPKMFPGFIGGHCVIPNLDLINEKKLDQINEINNIYLKNVKNAKSISKKYVKGKQSHDKK